MYSLVHRFALTQVFRIGVSVLLMFSGSLCAAAAEKTSAMKFPVANSSAKTQKEMKPYVELIEHTDAEIKMTPIPGGVYTMGSPAQEKNRRPDEGPQHQVKIEPFWMSTCEITWDAYLVWMEDLDILRREVRKIKPNARDIAADEYQLSQPTGAYTDMTFDMGEEGYPAICMTQLSGKIFCKWLTEKTGHYYRLPTEAEWEYACRAGTKTAYHFGDDPAKINEYAWHNKNCYDEENEANQYHLVGTKKPNPWGLYDMHGNVSEWVLDQYTTDFYGKTSGKIAEAPLANPLTLYPRVVRGGSWKDKPEDLRSAARFFSNKVWKKQDSQDPKSIWYHTEAHHVGFRIIRPLHRPTAKEMKEKWDRSLPVQDRKRGR